MITKYGNKYFNDVDGNVLEDEPEATYLCENCGSGIFTRDKFYKIEGRAFCRKCARRNCVDILRCFGGKDEEVELPICESCKEEIRGNYIVFNGCNYCDDCIANFGEELIEEIFGKAKTAEKPEEWTPD